MFLFFLTCSLHPGKTSQLLLLWRWNSTVHVFLNSTWRHAAHPRKTPGVYREEIILWKGESLSNYYSITWKIMNLNHILINFFVVLQILTSVTVLHPASLRSRDKNVCIYYFIMLTACLLVFFCQYFTVETNYFSKLQLFLPFLYKNISFRT